MKKFLKWTLIVVIGLAVLGAIVSKNDKKSDKKDAAVSDLDTTKVTADVPVDNWSYGEDVDKMTSEKKVYAVATSTNQVEFEFPYQGGSSFDLGIKKQGKGKPEIYLSVSKGQFLPNVLGDRSLKFKFDDEKPINIGFTETSDGRADVVFITEVNRVLTKLKTAKKLMVEAEFFQAGSKVAEFDVAGLKWQ